MFNHYEQLYKILFKEFFYGRLKTLNVSDYTFFKLLLDGVYLSPTVYSGISNYSAMLLVAYIN